MDNLPRQIMLRVTIETLGFLEPAVYQEGLSRLTQKDARAIQQIYFRGTGKDVRLAMDSITSPEGIRTAVIETLRDMQEHLKGPADCLSIDTRSLVDVLRNAYLADVKKIDETPFLELLCFMYTQPEGETRKLAFPLALADDWRRNFLSKKHAVAPATVDRPSWPVAVHQELNKVLAVHIPQEDFEYLCTLIKERKRLDEELLTYVKTGRAQQKTIERITAQAQDLERKLKGREDEIRGKEAAYNKLKSDYETLARDRITRKDYESAIENLRTEIQLYKEGNKALERTADNERRRAKQISNEKAQLEERLRKIDTRNVVEIQRAAVETMQKYRGKKVVVWGGHIDQARKITQILEPYGAKIEHVTEEYARNREVPMGADLIIHYTGHSSHTGGKRLESYDHPHVVEFLDTKANLIPSLIAWAQQHFNNNGNRV